MKRVLMGLAAIAAIACIPQTTSAQSAADLTLVHGIPGTTVDLTVDGTVVIDAFVPGSLANISSFAGQTLQNVTVTDDATDDVVIGPIASLVIPASGSHSLVAHLDADGTPVLSTFENNTADASTGDARLTLRHTAEAPAVDLIVGDQRPIVGATNGQSAELELPDGALTDAQLAPTGDVAIAEIATLDLAANTNTIVYAVGSVEDDTLDFVVQIVDFAVTAPTTTTTVAGATTTSAVPTAVNTGSPLGGSSSTTLVVVALGGLALAGGAMFARRHV
ncbi:MAG: hypothetical protein R8G01_15120 [Ilumatobacteraceae bacterium]|nr:hypothetical protein [Ilumatobacteraceae bacterium]